MTCFVCEYPNQSSSRLNRGQFDINSNSVNTPFRRIMLIRWLSREVQSSTQQETKIRSQSDWMSASQFQSVHLVINCEHHFAVYCNCSVLHETWRTRTHAYIASASACFEYYRSMVTAHSRAVMALGCDRCIHCPVTKVQTVWRLQGISLCHLRRSKQPEQSCKLEPLASTLAFLL